MRVKILEYNRAEILSSLEKEAKKFRHVKDFIQSRGMILYHGTHTKFDYFKPEFAELGYHFGTRKQASYRVSQLGGGFIREYVVNIQNPYEIVSDLGDWLDMEMLEEYLTEGNEGPFTNKQFAKFKDAHDVREALKKLGFDGMEYDNAFEGNVNGANFSYIAFDPEQIELKSTLIGIWNKTHKKI
jgi:hypothetical protein